MPRAQWLGHFRHDERGAVSFMVATFGIGLVAALAIAVDVSNVYLTRRQQQGALDLAAIAAARDLNSADRTARSILAANGFADAGDLQVVLGRYEPDGGRDASGRFVADGRPSNAVKLVMTRPAPLYFGGKLLGGSVPAIRTRSVAANTRVAAFTIGTRLASLNGGVANVLLSKLLGAEVSLNVMDYNALASATVDMPDLLRALPPRLNLTAASYDQVLSLNPTLGQLLAALGDSLLGSSQARLALTRLVQSTPTKRVDLRQMFSLGPFGKLALNRPTGVSAEVTVLDVLFTALGVANGNTQVDVDLGLQVPGLLGLTASVTIGERPQTSPWLAMGAEDVTVRTVQTRVRVAATVTAPLGLLSVKLPVAVDVAAGTARLSFARCGANPRTDAQATLEVKPTLVELWVGEPARLADWNDFAKPPDVAGATLLDSLLLTATASSHVAATNMSPRSVDFSAAEITAKTVKTVKTTDILQTTLTSLVGELYVNVSLKLLGLSLGTPQSVSNALAAVVRPLGVVLDPILNDVLKLVGVGLGEADVSVKGIRCDGSALVM